MMAWGSTGINSAVNGLTALIRRHEWRDHPDAARLRELLRPLLDSPDDTVRMIASMVLPLLVAPEALTSELSERLMREENDSVLQVLLGNLASNTARDPEGVDACLALLATRPVWSLLAGSPEDTARPINERRSESGDLLLRVLLYLGLVKTTPFAYSLIATWLADPLQVPARLGRLIAWTRPYMNPPGDESSASQDGAYSLITSLTDSAVTIVATTQEILKSGKTLSDEEMEDFDSAAWIATCIAREIYHASGAFQTSEEQARPDERIVAPSFSTLSFPVIEKLASVRGAGIAHHLVMTLVFLSRREPKRAFLAVAQIATPGSRYEYESMGETEVLDLVDLYLADRRELVLNDTECLSGLRQILETFVGVGSDRAIRRVQDLGELFR